MQIYIETYNENSVLSADSEMRSIGNYRYIDLYRGKCIPKQFGSLVFISEPRKLNYNVGSVSEISRDFLR